jgi:hypothetical protein
MLVFATVMSLIGYVQPIVGKPPPTVTVTEPPDGVLFGDADVV